MVRILLTEHMVRICQYRTYGRGQGGRSWLGIDRQGRWSSKGVDCDILTQGLIGFDRILRPSRYSFFFENPTEKNSWVKRA
jgi:hypothetical protein